MFLTKDRRFGRDNFVFMQTDPRAQGYKGEVVEGVTLDFDMNQIHLWPDGQPQPNPRLGRDPKDPKHYRVFNFPIDLHSAGFEVIHEGVPFVVYSWSDYRKSYYPVPEEYAKEMSSDEWFDFLEEADFATRLRKKMNGVDEPKRGSNLDEIAKWVASRHMGADGGINQVWFLPSGSPANEIRLLEVSDRFTGQAAKIEPIDFGLDVGGAKYKLLVGDISAEQIERIKVDPVKILPKDWRFDGALAWDRRGKRL
jgi:hypothetical protein